jgi:membrane protein DedA with SNARE-associated domain
MIFDFFSVFVENILLFIHKVGYFGIFLGMTLESTFIPIPSEMILIPAGVLIAEGKLYFFPVFVASILGSLAGALINYALAFFVGRASIEVLVSKYGKFFFISKKNLEKSENFFKKYGNISTFLGRLIPGARHLISIPAGFFKMDIKSFLFFTAVGSGIWSCILIAIGFFFKEISFNIISQNSIILYLVSFAFCILAIIAYSILKQKK